MSPYSNDDPILEAYLYETGQIVESLENLIMHSEKMGNFNKEGIDEIFRFMHTIKGSSAMMLFDGMSTVSHKIEDIFYLIRKQKESNYDFSRLIDLILESIDYFKGQLAIIQGRGIPEEAPASLVESILDYCTILNGSILSLEQADEQEAADEQQKYYIRPSEKQENLTYAHATVFFKEGCEMENIRAYTIVHNMADQTREMHFIPRDIIENEKTAEQIRSSGFSMLLASQLESEALQELFAQTIFLERLEFEIIEQDMFNRLALDYCESEPLEAVKIPMVSPRFKEQEVLKQENANQGSGMISVQIDKLDRLMDAVGELVIAESMVTQNPEITRLGLESFQKSTRHLHKITSELQDMVMAIRMVPLSTTFVKMNRIVRDMSKKMGKQVELEIIGEETEVDKNVIEKISDPLMHMIRNAVDHGIEEEAERADFNKPVRGTVTLEARNSGSDVLIIIKDDGRGLDKNKIYQKAADLCLVEKTLDSMADQEIFNLILLPGFSTKAEVSEFSGRGVGMDVVAKNIQSIGGKVQVESRLHYGTIITLKIPLTLAILEGMNLRVGECHFTLPMMAIKESFRPDKKMILEDTHDREMILVRGVCYPILRLHALYKVKPERTQLNEGILIMAEAENKTVCIFADELIGQQQVVMKSIPTYLKRFTNMKGIGGCTLLGDGSISLVLDVGTLNYFDSAS